MVSSSTTTIELLTPHNYHTWKPRFLNLIAQKGLTHLLEEKQPTFTKEYEIFVHKGKLYEAMGQISSSIS